VKSLVVTDRPRVSAEELTRGQRVEHRGIRLRAVREIEPESAALTPR
jgi:hypothetical protein